MDRQRIDEKVSMVLQEHQIDPSNGYDIVSLAKSMGFFVATGFLEENEDGFIMVNSDGTKLLGTESSKVIIVNSSRNQNQKRFIIAHELGHYLINGKDKQIFAHRKKEDEVRAENEQEVDYFAASLLMPKEAFQTKSNHLISEGKDLSERVMELAKIFRAPVDSVLRRVEELNLIINEDSA